MTYESHTVRSLRRDPVPGETVRLVLTLADSEGAPDADSASGAEGVAADVGDRIDALGGEVLRELPFDRLLVEVAQTDLADVRDLDGVQSVETDAVIDSPS
ncbi:MULTISPECIES: hypothetical protein [Halorussus]|uniref:hypothetical protein n=1 Tax=Halorussus TaxID=1070314 RepID=UPI0020A1B3A8|nr:hypothetical protein [Halorussus vallis]USZ75794.1 hypothetical protein NGM07_00355 [Halorussus vallis]